jgi:SAM-dependent methyltransferase
MANKDITESGVQEVLRTMGIPTSFEGLQQGMIGRAETLATLGTGMGASAVGGLAGLAELARTRDLSSAVNTIEETQQKYTYQPRTQEGAQTLGRYGSALEALATPSEFVGEQALQMTGSPAAATGAEILLDPLSAVVPGISKVSKAVRPTVKALEGAKEAGQAVAKLEDVYTPEAIKIAERETGRKGRSVVVDMPIDEFLSLAKEGEEAAKTEALKDVNKFNQIVTLNTASENGVAKVTSHEGRHRARRMREMGYDTIPVKITDRLIRFDQQTEGNFDYEENFPTRLVGETGEYETQFPVQQGQSGFVKSSQAPQVQQGLADQAVEANRLIESGYPESVARRIASGELPMDQASRRQRADDQGFNQRAYMGIREGAEDIYELDPDVGMGARRGTGNWMAQNPVQAETYARESTMPLSLNTSNYARVDFGGQNWNDKPSDLELELPNGEVVDVSGMDTNEIARKARELGVSGVQFEQITDLGPISRKVDKDALREYYEYGDTQFVVFDPTTAKSKPSSAFDPEYVGPNILGNADPRLLAGIAGGSLIGAGLMSNEESESKMANKDITENGVRNVLETMGIPTSFQGLKENVVGRAETLATLGSGMAGAYAGMGGGLLEMMRSGRPDLAIDEYRRIQEAMTYMPRTQGGIERVQAIGGFLEPVAKAYEQYGQQVGETTGSPVVGEFAQEFVDPLDMLGLGVVSAIPLAARKGSRFAENAASQTTQRANTVGTAKKASNYLDEIGAKGKTLDYGAGLGENAKAINADETFEPFPQGEFNPTYTDPADVPANAYGRIVSTNVLNVLPPDIRLEAVQTIGKALEPGGTALIQTWDVGAAKAGMKSKKATPVPDEENAYTTSTGSYQKGFSKQELQEYIANTLGRGYVVEPVPNKAGISGTAVTIKKIADPSVQVDLGIPEAELDAIAEQTLRLYHGSPYDFDAFDPEKALTGEGAQAYGYGAAYTSFEPDVARGYRENRDNQSISQINDQLKQVSKELSEYETGEYGVYSDPIGYELKDQYDELLNQRQMLVDNDPNIRINDEPILDVYNSLTGARATDTDYQKAEIIEQIMIDGDVLGVMQRQTDYGDYDPEIYKWFEEEVAPNFSRKGVLYELNVSTSKENLLDFDKPVKDQPEKVKKALLDAGIKENTAGRFAYYYLAPNAKGVGAQKEATKVAQSLGIDGIIYEDPHSPAGTKNVVVFDPRIIEIAKKYGVAIPVAAKIFEQAQGSQEEQPQA